MIEKPDVPDAIILQALEARYSIRAGRIEFIPHGLDSSAWAYRVDAGETAYFVKVTRKKSDWIGAWMPAFLARRGLRDVIAPLPANDGNEAARVDGLRICVQPYIAGQRGMDIGLSGAQWHEFGAFLRRLHSLDLPTEISSRLRAETFTSRRLGWVRSMNERIGDAESPDPIASQMLAVWRDRTGEISALIERTSILMDQARESQLPPVLCHADVHTANLLVGADGGLYVVDWDDAMLAPKERDLMFVLADAGGSDRERFFDGYGAAEIDATALAYYQHDWAIEDIGAFAEEILDIGSAGAATRSNSLGWFKQLFAPGDAVETALRSNVDFGMTTGMALGARSHAK